MFLLAATGLLLTATTAASEPLVLNDGAPLPGFEKFLLTDAAEQHGAVCLDGSPGGGYIKRGDPDKWIVFHQGGGWCNSDANCAKRANCSASPPGCIMGGDCCALGSSTVWGPTYTDKYEGSMLFQDPTFANYTQVYAMYCDGGSWTGDAAAAVPVGGASIFYRGRPLLEALLQYLLAQGMRGATELLYGGCSAGGLTAYLHCDYVASVVPPTVETRCLADAMFSAAVPKYDGQSGFPVSMQWGFGAWNSSGSANAACAASIPLPEDRWQCFFGQHVARFVATPLFVLNSKYDSWQGPAIIGCSTALEQCPAAAQAYWNTYGETMAAAALALPPQHGAFIANCRAHCQTGTASAWASTTVNGTAMGNAFKQWYFSGSGAGAGAGASGAGPFRWVEGCTGNDGTCGADTCGA